MKFKDIALLPEMANVKNISEERVKQIFRTIKNKIKKDKRIFEK